MSNNRKRGRFSVAIEIHVVGENSEKNIFHEVCKSKDASTFGVSMKIKNAVRPRTILYFVMPMPNNLRLHDIEKPLYQAYGVVRYVRPLPDGFYQIGVSILGKILPKGYEHYEKIVFETPSSLSLDEGNERAIHLPLKDTIAAKNNML